MPISSLLRSYHPEKGGNLHKVERELA